MKETIFSVLFFIGCGAIGSIGADLFLKNMVLKQVKNEYNQRVVEAFKDVKWSTQTFGCGSESVLLEDTDGYKHFYAAKPIDLAIEKLNVFLDEDF